MDSIIKPIICSGQLLLSLVNSQDQGDFYDGFAPEKYVPDDITHDWNDRNELCLKEAIYYLENGSVSSKGVYQLSTVSTVF